MNIKRAVCLRQHPQPDAGLTAVDAVLVGHFDLVSGGGFAELNEVGKTLLPVAEKFKFSISSSIVVSKVVTSIEMMFALGAVPNQFIEFLADAVVLDAIDDLTGKTVHQHAAGSLGVQAAGAQVKIASSSISPIVAPWVHFTSSA